MTFPPDGSPIGLRAEYAAAVEVERAEWKTANDISLDSVGRVQAYARWLAAAERVKALSIRTGGDRKSGASVA